MWDQVNITLLLIWMMLWDQVGGIIQFYTTFFSWLWMGSIYLSIGWVTCNIWNPIVRYVLLEVTSFGVTLILAVWVIGPTCIESTWVNNQFLVIYKWYKESESQHETNFSLDPIFLIYYYYYYYHLILRSHRCSHPDSITLKHPLFVSGKGVFRRLLDITRVV